MSTYSLHAVSSVENDGWQDDVEEDFRIEHGLKYDHENVKTAEAGLGLLCVRRLVRNPSDKGLETRRDRWLIDSDL